LCWGGYGIRFAANIVTVPKMNSTIISRLSHEYLPVFEENLRSIVMDSTAATKLVGQMLHYHMGWGDGLKSESGLGKRIRPLLTLLCTEAAGGHWRKAISIAAAVELIHNFSLIHDDIQDKSSLRRGRPTVWSLWGAEQAINAGDALFAHAHLVLQKEHALSPESKLDVLRLLDEACLSLTEGQAADIEFERKNQVDLDMYMNMIEGKTASLIAVSTELGALVSGASLQQRVCYRDFGYALGVAYQVRDDILGVWGRSSTTGKPTGDDLRARKKTLPIILGLERSDELRALYKQAPQNDAEVETVITVLEETGVLEEVTDIEFDKVEIALQKLSSASPKGVAGDALVALVRQLLGRKC